jgi:hypothetical protein
LGPVDRARRTEAEQLDALADDEVVRFFSTVKRLDDYLASDAPID